MEKLTIEKQLKKYVITKYENVNAETLAKICKALHCTFDDIMELVEEDNG